MVRNENAKKRFGTLRRFPSSATSTIEVEAVTEQPDEVEMVMKKPKKKVGMMRSYKRLAGKKGNEDRSKEDGEYDNKSGNDAAAAATAGGGDVVPKKSNGRRPSSAMPKRRLGSRQLVSSMRQRLRVPSAASKNDLAAKTEDSYKSTPVPQKPKAQMVTTPNTAPTLSPTSVSSATSTTYSSSPERSRKEVDVLSSDLKTVNTTSTEEISVASTVSSKNHASTRLNSADEVERMARDAQGLNQEFRHFLEYGEFPDADPSRLLSDLTQTHDANADGPVIARRLRFAAADDDDDDEVEDDTFEVETDSPGGVEAIARIARAAAALDSAGNDLFERGEYRRAMASYERSLRLKKRTLLAAATVSSERTSAAVAPNTATPRGATPNLPDVGTHVAGLDRSQRDAMLASVATSINNIGYIRQRSGRATAAETMAAYQDSLRIKQRILGSDSLSVAKTMNNIGSVYFSVKEFEPALSTYEEAHRIMVHNLGNDHLDVATVQSNIGDVHLARSEHDSALARYREALRIRWTQLGGSDPKVVRLLEKIASTMHHMQRWKGRRDANGNDGQEEDDGAYSDDETGKVEPISVRKECEELKTQVKADLTWINNIGRELALDMVKEKLNMIRELRVALDQKNGTRKDPDDDSIQSGPGLFFTEHDDLPSPPVKDRHADAVRKVKERLAKMKERKQKRMQEEGISALRSLSGFSTSDNSLAGTVLKWNQQVESIG